MFKKFFLILALATAISGAAFSQHKYKAADMLLGIDMAMGVTPNLYKFTSFPWPKLNLAATFELGLNYDVYLAGWLSLSTGVYGKTGAYFAVKGDVDADHLDLRGFSTTPVCLTFPLTIHINIPYANFFYIGGGGAVNIPLASWSVTKMNIGDSELSIGGKGSLFFSTPIDFGFDFVKKDKGGGRFIFRFAPEFHKEGIFLPVGIYWQFTNFRIYSRKY